MRADAMWLGGLMTNEEQLSLMDLWDRLSPFMRGELLPRVREEDARFYIVPIPIVIDTTPPAPQPPEPIDLRPIYRKLDDILDEVRRHK